MPLGPLRVFSSSLDEGRGEELQPFQGVLASISTSLLTAAFSSDFSLILVTRLQEILHGDR